MKNYFFIFIILAIGCGDKNSSLEQNPNIILILTDDQGWGDLSLHGNKNLSTPNIDKIAQEGVSLERFYVSPVCSPTRAEFLTGKYHHKTGVSGTSAGAERINIDEETIAEKLQEAGYRTGIFGKWHNGTQFPYHPLARGFDEFYGFTSGHHGNYFDPILDHNGEFVKGKGYITDDLTSHAISFIEKNSVQPFFVYIPFNTPHSPMQVPDKFYDRIKNTDLVMKSDKNDLEDVDYTKAALAMCENIDWNVGRIISKLSELKIDDNTIVIFMSDNGPDNWRWNNGLKGKKGSVDEGGVKVPFFIKWPEKLEAQKKISITAGAIDLYPTLLSIVDEKFNSNESNLDGVNLKSILLGEVSNIKERKLFSRWRDAFSIRTANYFLDHEDNFYNLTEDPKQKNDLRKVYPSKFDELKKELNNWKSEIDMQPTLNRPFTVGFSKEYLTYLPARDANFSGNIKRSNQYPNSSYFTNWTNESDSIFWDVDVINEGTYNVEIFYTCKKENLGSSIVLSATNSELLFTIDSPFESEEIGEKYDRVPRKESYVKNFNQLKVGEIKLLQGEQTILLQANDIANSEVMEFGGLILRYRDK